MRCPNYQLQRLRTTFGVVLAMLAVVALLMSQAGLVLHTLHHLADAGERDGSVVTLASGSAELTDAGKSQSEGFCLQCLEGASHTTALTPTASAVIATGAHVVAVFVVPADFTVRVSGHPRQRGPPATST